MTYNELEHHGIKGQKWGERRFQNEDGSLTPAGKERYGVGDGRKTNTTGKGESIYRRGSGLGTGPVGKVSGSFKTDNTTKKKTASPTRRKTLGQTASGSAAAAAIAAQNVRGPGKYNFRDGVDHPDIKIDDVERKNYKERYYSSPEQEAREDTANRTNTYFDSTLKSIRKKTNINPDELKTALQIVAAQKGWNINQLIKTNVSIARTFKYGWLTPELFAEAVTYCYKKNANYYNFRGNAEFNENIKNLIKNLKRKGTPEYKAVQNMVAYEKDPFGSNVKHFEISYDHLEHHGIEGQKWRHRRFQYEDGSLTPEGRIRYGKMKKKAKTRVNEVHKAKNKKKESDDNSIKKMSEKNKKEIKERLMNNPNANELYKYRDLFTYDELNNAYNRLVLQNKIRSEIVDKGKIRVKKLLEKADSLSKLAISVSTITEKGYNIYSNARKIDYLSKNKNSFAAPNNKTDNPKQNDKNPGKNKDSK